MDKSILFISEQPQRFLDQLEFANSLIEQNKQLTIKFFIGGEVYKKYDSIIDSLPYTIINSQDNRVLLKQKIKNIIKSILSDDQKIILKNYLYSIKQSKLFETQVKNQEIALLKELNNKYKIIYELVKRSNIGVVFINGDRHLATEPVFIKVARDLNIKTIIPYMVFFAELEGLVKTSSVLYQKEMFYISDYIKQSQHKFMYQKRREKYYYPHVLANALHTFGVLSKNPWFMGGGYSDILCLPNFNMKKHYIDNGIEKEKIIIVGDTTYDKLYQRFIEKDNIKLNIRDKYSLDHTKKILIIALPQLGEHNILPWSKHWKEIDFLMNSLNSLEQNILISLHPKMDRTQYEFLESKYNCKILDERLADVLPISDIFVVTFSSTVVWAILCGIKTVVVDFYDLNYTMYDFLTSIKKVDNKNNFIKVLNNVIEGDVDFTNDWKSLSKEEVFDGKTIERYIDLIEEVS